MRTATLFLALTGCSHTVYSPPARLAPMQTPAVTEGVAISGEGSSQGALFGPDVIGGAARVRVGLGETVELSGEAMVVHVDGDSSADTHPNIYGARVGGKWAPEAVARFVAVTFGVGGGGHAGGGYVAPDLGFVFGYENPYVVPFVSVEATNSFPISPREVDTSSGDDEPGAHVDEPYETFALRATTGLRVPMTLAGTGNKASFYFALTSIDLQRWDEGVDDGERFTGFASGMEVEF